MGRVMMGTLAEYEGRWVWSTCTITVSVEGDTNFTINARGALGWKMEANYAVEEVGKLVRKGMKMVGQPLQQPEVEQDDNMKPVRKLLMTLANISLDGAVLTLSSANKEQLISFTKAQEWTEELYCAVIVNCLNGH